MDTHPHLRNPNPFEDTRMSLREALIGLGGWTAVLGVAWLADQARSSKVTMSLTQREYLKEVLASKPAWVDLSDTTANESKWMARHSDGAAITISVVPTSKGNIRNIEVLHSKHPFKYACPEGEHSKHDKALVERMLASARGKKK